MYNSKYNNSKSIVHIDQSFWLKNINLIRNNVIEKTRCKKYIVIVVCASVASLAAREREYFTVYIYVDFIYNISIQIHICKRRGRKISCLNNLLIILHACICVCTLNGLNDWTNTHHKANAYTHSSLIIIIIIILFFSTLLWLWYSNYIFNNK